MGKLPLRARLATTVAGAAGRMSRLSGRGDGSVIGGAVGLRMEPDLLRLLAADRQIVLVTGTNGKTTTTRLITAALEALGQEVATNAFGANMEAGLASALGRAPDAPFGVLEVDERYLPAMIETTRPRVVALLNLSRDQMDRARRASAGTRTPGAAPTAGRTCAGTTSAGGAANAAWPGPRPGGCSLSNRSSTPAAGSASWRSRCRAGRTGPTR